MFNSRLTRLIAAGGLVVSGVMAFAGAASAHVTVHSADATQGAYAVLVFRVPNEKDKASTTTLEVDFPKDTPFKSASTQPKPGWTATVSMTTLPAPVQINGTSVSQVVDKIVWTGGTIGVGQFDEFQVSTQLPKTPSVQFKALQTYSDGDIVRWIENTAAGGAEPEHPAPTLTLPSATPQTQNTAPPSVISEKLVKQSDVDTTKTISIAALVVGIVGLITAAGTGLVKGRRKTT